MYSLNHDLKENQLPRSKLLIFVKTIFKCRVDKLALFVYHGLHAMSFRLGLRPINCNVILGVVLFIFG